MESRRWRSTLTGWALAATLTLGGCHCPTLGGGPGPAPRQERFFTPYGYSTSGGVFPDLAAPAEPAGPRTCPAGSQLCDSTCCAPGSTCQLEPDSGPASCLAPLMRRACAGGLACEAPQTNCWNEMCSLVDEMGKSRISAYAPARYSDGRWGRGLQPALDQTCTGEGIYGTLTQQPAGSAPCTMEVWARTTYRGTQAVVSYGVPHADRSLELVAIGPGANASLLRFRLGDQACELASPLLQDGVWHHLAGVFTNTDTALLYVDGQPLGSCQLPAQPNTESIGHLRVGNIGRPSGTDPCLAFVGEVDELRILSYARLAAGIAQDALGPLTVIPSTVGLWHFDEGPPERRCCAAGSACGQLGGCIGQVLAQCPPTAPVTCADGGCCPQGMDCDPRGCSTPPNPCDGGPCNSGGCCTASAACDADSGACVQAWTGRPACITGGGCGVSCCGPWDLCVAGQCVTLQGLGTCDAGTTACGGNCCPDGTACTSTRTACVASSTRAGGNLGPACTGGYCPEGTSCSGDGGCCSSLDLTCAAACCARAAVCGAAGTCACPSPKTPCGAACCNEDQSCVDGACVTSCESDQTPCGRYCCLPGTACAGDHCACPATHPDTCDGQRCCLADAGCLYAFVGASNCGCPAGREVCGDWCCATGEVCRDGQCSPSGGSGSGGGTGGEAACAGATCGPGELCTSDRNCVQSSVSGSCSCAGSAAGSCKPSSTLGVGACVAAGGASVNVNACCPGLSLVNNRCRSTCP